MATHFSRHGLLYHDFSTKLFFPMIIAVWESSNQKTRNPQEGVGGMKYANLRRIFGGSTKSRGGGRAPSRRHAPPTASPPRTWMSFSEDLGVSDAALLDRPSPIRWFSGNGPPSLFGQRSPPPIRVSSGWTQALYKPGHPAGRYRYFRFWATVRNTFDESHARAKSSRDLWWFLWISGAVPQIADRSAPVPALVPAPAHEGTRLACACRSAARGGAVQLSCARQSRRQCASAGPLSTSADGGRSVIRN